MQVLYAFVVISCRVEFETYNISSICMSSLLIHCRLNEHKLLIKARIT